MSMPVSRSRRRPLFIAFALAVSTIAASADARPASGNAGALRDNTPSMQGPGEAIAVAVPGSGTTRAGMPLVSAAGTSRRSQWADHFMERGYASWYGAAHHGQETTSGEPFDLNQMTAAHKTLPFGSRVLVTDLQTARSVEVRINDRGPHVKGRIIDLSLAAARRLGFAARGVTRVGLTLVDGRTRDRR
jgi:rare lipoprotein A